MTAKSKRKPKVQPPKPVEDAPQAIAQPQPMSDELRVPAGTLAKLSRQTLDLMLRNCWGEIDRLRAEVAAKDAEIARLKFDFGAFSGQQK